MAGPDVSPEQRKQLMVDEVAPALYNGYGRRVNADVRPLATDSKGFVATLDDPQMLFAYQKLKVEADRMNVLVDSRVILTEAGYIDALAHGFVTWTTVERPRLIFKGKSKIKAEQVVNDMLERIGYWKNRKAYLYNGIYLELYLKKEVSWDPDFINTMTNNPTQTLSYVRQGKKIGGLDGLLGPLPAETMFRNSNHQDRFDNAPKSFCQIPEPYNRTPANSSGLYSIPKEWFHHVNILHPRWNHLCNKVIRYSRPALMPIRKAYNRAELGGTDAAISRHLASSRVINYALNANLAEGDREAGPERIKEMRRTLEQLYPSGMKAGTVHVSSGADKIDVLDSLNLQLSKPEDLRFHLDLVFLSFLMPPQLQGYSGGEGKNLNGPMLQQLCRTLEVNIGLANSWERDELLLPLVYFELFLNGIYDVEVSTVFGLPSFDNQAVEKKNDQAEVGLGLRAPRSYYEKWNPGGDYLQEKKDIKEYKDEIGDPTPSQLDQKAIDPNKGNSGDPRPVEKQVPKPPKP